MKVYDCPQQSESWWELHRGIVTAGRADKLLTPKTGKPSASADDLICELIAEIHHDGPVSELYPPPTWDMRNGQQTEAEARAYYEMETGQRVRQVGFCLSDCGRFGCSPDGLVGEDGLLELKCPRGKSHVRYLLSGELPDDYRPQCHMQLIVTGRAWVDFLSYRPGLPRFVVRVTPDDYTDRLAAALEQFYDRFLEAKDLIAKGGK